MASRRRPLRIVGAVAAATIAVAATLVGITLAAKRRFLELAEHSS